MGIGPVPAIQKLRERIGLGLDDFDLVELNEAFAAQVLAVLNEAPIPADRLNVNGGAIALGHRSAPPARASSSPCCTSSSGAARNAAWRRCA